MLAHAFEQGGLCAGRGAVDFVREQDVREDGTAAKDEFGSLLIEIVDAGDVGRKQVGGELDTLRIRGNGFRQRLRERGFSRSGNVVEKNVAAAQKGRDDQADLFVLTVDGARHIFFDGAREFRNDLCVHGNSPCLKIGFGLTGFGFQSRGKYSAMGSASSRSRISSLCPLAVGLTRKTQDDASTERVRRV